MCITIVERDIALTLALSDNLKTEGYVIESVHRGDEAVRKLAEKSTLSYARGLAGDRFRGLQWGRTLRVASLSPLPFKARQPRGRDGGLANRLVYS